MVGGYDVGTEAAASLVAARLRLLLQLLAVLIVLLLALSDVHPIIAIVVLLLLARVFQKLEFLVPGAFYYAVTGHVSASLRERAYLYYFLSERHAGQTWKRRWLTFVPQLFGFILLASAGLSVAYNSDTLATGIPGLYIRHTGIDPKLLWIVLLVAGLLLLNLATRLEARLRRSDMKALTSLKGNRDPNQATVLFLREFGSETITVPRHSAPRDPSLLGSVLPIRSIPLEEAITWMCWSYGAVLAIADPRGAKETTVAAAQHLVGREDDWQEVVTQLADRAVMVIVIAGDTAGIQWEINMLRQQPARASKTLIVNPDPSRPQVFLSQLGLSATSSETESSKTFLIAVSLDEHGPQQIVSDLAEDVDYEAAVQRQARKIGLTALQNT